jgi:excisionase family DNA binding protein
MTDHKPRPLTASDILRAKDVAKLLHIPVSTVHEWARRGIIPSRKIGRHRILLRFELMSWLVSRTSGG